MEKPVTLAVGPTELKFVVSTENYNRFTNELQTTDKVAPSISFLRRCLVDKEQRPALDELCDQGLAVELAGKLFEEFRPEVEIVVKK